jgi:hypothetical protein
MKSINLFKIDKQGPIFEHCPEMFLYGHGAWSPTPRKEHGLRVLAIFWAR